METIGTDPMTRNITVIHDNTDVNDWPLGEFEKLDINETPSRARMSEIPPDLEKMPSQSSTLISGQKAKLDFLPSQRESSRRSRLFCQQCRKAKRGVEVV